MHITLTGNLGSGKSTISKIMSTKYGYEIYSTGKIQRELAAERGLSVIEMNKLMESDHSFDHIIDDTVRKISEEHKEDLFFDSRLAWHFAVNSFKVFLSVNINEAARRVFNDNRGDVESYSSIADAKSSLIERANLEDERYREIYGIDYFNLGNYNLILDSTISSPEVLASIIEKEKEAYEARVASGTAPEDIPVRILMSPSRLLKSDSKVDVDDDDIFETDSVTIAQGGEDFNVVDGIDTVWKALHTGFEFIVVHQ